MRAYYVLQRQAATDMLRAQPSKRAALDTIAYEFCALPPRLPADRATNGNNLLIVSGRTTVPIH